MERNAQSPLRRVGRNAGDEFGTIKCNLPSTIWHRQPALVVRLSEAQLSRQAANDIVAVLATLLPPLA